MKLQAGDWFVLGIVALQVAAVLAYLWKRRWLDALLYTCWATAQVVVLILALRART